MLFIPVVCVFYAPPKRVGDCECGSNENAKLRPDEFFTIPSGHEAKRAQRPDADDGSRPRTLRTKITTADGKPIVTVKPIYLLPAILFAATTAASTANQRPNVLLLFADDQRADTIAALGNPHIQTPNLDRLVRAGLSFDRAYMQGGMNGATCVPSRAMLLSGRSLFRIDEKLLRDETWPAAFARAGYATFMSGKWHNGANSVAKSFQTARGVFTGGMGDPLKV